MLPNTMNTDAPDQSAADIDGQSTEQSQGTGYTSDEALLGSLIEGETAGSGQDAVESAAPMDDASPLAGDHAHKPPDVSAIVAQTVQETIKGLLPMFQQMMPTQAPAATEPEAPRGPAVGDVQAIALQAARGALGDHASPDALADYARQYIGIAKLEGFKDAEGWNNPKAQAQIQAAQEQFRRYDTQARENAALRAELNAIKSQINAPKPVDRGEILSKNEVDLEGYLTGFAWTNPQTGQRVEDASGAQFPLVTKLARGGKMKAVIERVHARMPTELDADNYAGSVIQALAQLEADAKIMLEHQQEADKAKTPQAAATPPSNTPPTNPGQGANGAMRSKPTGYVSDDEIFASLG